MEARERLLTPQQELFLERYTNPKSPTFANALRSALEAKYSQEYAESITHQMPDWLAENLGDLKLLRKAERVLNKTLDFEPVDEQGKLDNGLLAIQNKTAQFVAETIGKNKGYTKKVEQEHTNPDGNLKTIIINKYGSDNQPTS